MSVLIICEGIICLLLYNFHDSTFKSKVDNTLEFRNCTRIVFEIYFSKPDEKAKGKGWWRWTSFCGNIRGGI